MEAENSARIAGVRVHSVVASVSGEFITTSNSRGRIKVSSKNGEITRTDISRVLESAHLNKPEEGKQVIHAVPKRFFVDRPSTTLKIRTEWSVKNLRSKHS